jgi:hypothetical protein
MSYGTTKHTLVSFHMVSNLLGLGGGVTSLCMSFNHGNQIVVQYYGDTTKDYNDGVRTILVVSMTEV